MNHIPSPDTSDAGIERDIKAVGADKFPRVTPADLQANIVSEHYFTAGKGAFKNPPGQEGPFGEPGRAFSPLDLLTFCVLVLRNGFTVTGESACASPENFNEEIGRKIARENAVQKVWPLMGYHLKQTLHEKATAPVSDFLGRLRAEHHELNERLGKLQSFIDGPVFLMLPDVDQGELRIQEKHMREYSTTLSRRLGQLS